MQKAFTLIELLVVVLIIGILSAIALPQYQTAVYKAKYMNLKPLVTSIAQAEEVYYLANQSYTSDFEKLDVSVPAPTSTSSTTSRTTYSYPWGYCFIDSSAVIMCRDGSAHIRYARFFNYASHASAGKQSCEVDDNDPIAHKICKNDSGLSTHTGGGVSYGNYEYTW